MESPLRRINWSRASGGCAASGMGSYPIAMGCVVMPYRCVSTPRFPFPICTAQKLYSSSDLAKVARVSRRTISEMARNRRIPVHSFTPGGHARFDESGVEAARLHRQWSREEKRAKEAKLRRRAKDRLKSLSAAKKGSGSGIPNIEAVVVFFRQWRRVNAARILTGPLETQERLIEEMQPIAALIDQLRANVNQDAGSSHHNADRHQTGDFVAH